VIFAIAAGGCAVGPDFRRPEPPKVSRYTAGREPDRTLDPGTGAEVFTPGKDVARDWFRLFGSDAASRMVSRALANNRSLRAARANLSRSEELLRAGYGVFFPQVDAQLGAGYQRFSTARFGIRTAPPEFALYTLSGSVSYLVDVWGGERRQVEALGAQRDADRYALAGARVMICGNVMNALIARAAYVAEADATRATLELQREQVRITEAQATAGTVPFVNVLAIRSQLASTEALIPALEQRVDAASHLLATLAGGFPSQGGVPDVALTDFVLPRDVPVSLPSQLVRQRPDILVAESALHAANAAIGVATAAMLPNLTLSGNIGTNAASLGDLFTPNSVFWGLTAGLAAPLFHGGTLYHERKAAIAARDGALATYEETVLGAFEQVADTLRALVHDAEALRAQKEAVDSAEEALRLVQINYRAGVSDYLQVIFANRQFLQAKIAYLDAVAERLQDTVTLYVALGGGWWS
jgi:NodT family efflux transporter outer membrane factor (OMF) lipoprotein